jgi:lipopolysaccharide/colanic/teichoic acid biosynthesis glycosyltransferase
MGVREGHDSLGGEVAETLNDSSAGGQVATPRQGQAAAPQRLEGSATSAALADPGLPVLGGAEALPAPEERPRRRRQRSAVILRRRRYDLCKRAFDLGFSLAILPAALLLMAVCAGAIWLIDGSPILFPQSRTGRGGQRFKLYKFRTMVNGASELKAQLLGRNQLSGPDFKIADDPRVTPLGRLLRKYSLDELPQLFNVLKGDMSLVGPRPTSFRASHYQLWQTERLEVVPGISGLWQVSGRSEVDFDERVRLDIEYVARRSLLFDLSILVRTIGAVIRARGAY